jgi:hypothetical protein
VRGRVTRIGCRQRRPRQRRARLRERRRHLLDPCHKAENAVSNGGGFDMTTPGWERKLIGNGPPDSAPKSNLCKGKNLVYLEPGMQPAVGLFIQKVKPNPPCGVQMPMLLEPLSSGDVACIQMWANNVVAGGTGQ